MKGLSFGETPFSTLFAPILPPLNELWWLVNFQSNPFDFDWETQNEQLLGEAMLRLPVLETSGSLLWRPSNLARLIPGIKVFGEWSSLTGFACKAEDPTDAVRRLEGSPTVFPAFDEIERLGGILIVQVDGWWEVYSSREEWLESLARSHRGRPVDSANLGENYPKDYTVQ